MRLEANIDWNPGISFVYNHETGKITVSKNNGETFYLDSGLKGTTLGAIDDGETVFALNQWMPVGTRAKVYAGTFGLIGDINANNSYSGHVKNLTAGENSLIPGYQCGDSGFTGGISAMAMSIDTLANCINRATVVGKSGYVSFNSSVSRVGVVGGIVGCMAGKAESCENYGTVVSDNYAGGIAGILTGCSGDAVKFIGCK